MGLAVFLLAAALDPQDPPGAPMSAPLAAPQDPEAHLAAGIGAFKERRFREALGHFQRAAEADPRSAAAAFYLGYTYYAIAEPTRRDHAYKRQAAALFARAFALNPAFRPDWTSVADRRADVMAGDYLSPQTLTTGRLSDETLARHASARLAAASAQLFLDNDEAFRSKLELVTGARATIDAMYYIWADDHSSSVLAQALLAAARRGVRVRLLLDYHTNYKRLDLFAMLQNQARGGPGSLEVRLYNRPTRYVVRDAVYLTLGCGPAGRTDPGCAPASLAGRFAAVERRFEEERIDGRPARELGISNLNLRHSGVLLSGWYAKRPDVMALAVVQPPPTPPGRPLAAAAEPGALARAERRIALVQAHSFLSELLDPIEQAIRPFRPSRLAEVPEAARDWAYVTDYLHHKLLLVDRARLQLGGRNVEDSYHMQPNDLVEKYVFMDTDLRADLVSGGEDVERAFERLWDFRTMVATLDEVREHAPNDLVAALMEAKVACAGRAEEAARRACETEQAGRPLPLPVREERQAARLSERAERYRREYSPRPAEPRGWAVDQGAALYYVENLPFRGAWDQRDARRAYGARNGEEAYWGKRIHGLWIAGLTDACRAATAAAPRRVVLHNAYFLPPANLTRALARMVDGSLDCRHVSITILTNSIETTDLNVVNLLARPAMKAFAEHAQARGRPAGAARLRFYEYRKPAAGRALSLHSKVSLFGDDLMVGSANTDVRSFMMDSNNALFVRGAPKLAEAYLRHVDALLADPARTQDLTEYFARVSPEQMRRDDLALFDALLRAFEVDQYLDGPRRAAAQAVFLGLLDKVYALTRAVLAGGPDAAARAEEFNRIFKPI
jgi:phosphatidylserine/phosphatidylglycerophosphate/cardiolipin synthase-like enzyme